VIALLRHVRDRGFMAAPEPVGSGFAEDGREALYFIEGEAAPTFWSEPSAHRVGELVRELHTATSGFPTERASWMPWWGRGLPTDDLVLGHCDVAPWNFLARGGRPVALLDWDTAGPVGREWDVAQAAWLNAQLHDDDVAEAQGLPDVAARARLLLAFCEGYGLSREQRTCLVDQMLEVAVRTAAQEAIDAGVRPDGTSPTAMGLLGGGAPSSGDTLLWAVTWRVRSARWMSEHRATLERALV
jgi:Ser/Thr protein kinase RdoA (MazF antagonist)